MKTIFRIVVLLGFIQCNFNEHSIAQEVLRVSGYIRDGETGEQLPFATVLLVHRATGVSANRFGFYSFNTLPGDTALIRFSYVGYRSLDTTVIVKGQAQISLDIMLKQRTVQTEEIEVVGKLPFYDSRSFPSTMLFMQEQLEALPSVGEQDLFRSLQRIPGIASSSEVSSSLYIRGGSPDQTLIQLDGMPVYNPSHVFGFYSMFNLDAIKAVKVLKGGFPVEYGTRNGSVIDILSVEGNRNRLTGKAALGFINSSLFLNGPLGDGGWMFAARRSYLDILTKAAGYDEGPSYYFYDVHAQVNQDVGNNAQLKATFLINQDNLSFGAQSAGLRDDPKFLWNNTLAGIEWSKSLSSKLFLRAIGSFSRYRGYIDLPADLFLESAPGTEGAVVTFANRLLDYSGKLEMEFEFNKNHFLTGGLFYTGYELLYTAATPLLQKGTNITSRFGLMGMFLQDKVQIERKFLIIPGIRITNLFSNENSYFFEPRLLLSYQPSPDVTMKLGTGLYYQWLTSAQPTSILTFSGVDFWFPAGESNPAARALQLSGDVIWSPERGYSVTLSAYTNNATNAVELKQNFEESDRVDGMFQRGTGLNSGIELFIEGSSGFLRGAVGYSLSWALRKMTGINNGKTFPAVHDKRHTINVVGTMQLSESWSLNLGWTFSSGQAYTGIEGRYLLRPMGSENLFPPGGNSHSVLSSKNGLRLPSYHRLDLSIAKVFLFDQWKLRLRLDVFNVYNRRNALGANPDFSLNADPYYRLLPIVPTFTLEAEF